MDNDTISAVLHAEDGYHETVRAYAEDAERYVDESKKKQSVYLESLKYDWYLFEKSEKEKFEKSFAEDSARMENGAAETKRGLKAMQEEKIDEISERLKREVLAFLWR